MGLTPRVLATFQLPPCCSIRYNTACMSVFRKVFSMPIDCPETPRQACPLCKTGKTNHLLRDVSRDYFHCSTCELIFVPSTQFLSEEEEKVRYDLHQNSPDDPKYRQFLSRIFQPMQERLAPESHGLDFGSGPGPTLSVMFEEAGHTVALYDRYYAKDASVLDTQHDFITATEVFEHLHDPGMELRRLWGCLKRGGHLGIMTVFAPEPAGLAKWYYKNDLTHVAFFALSTFDWIAVELEAESAFIGTNVIILRKP